MTAYAVKMQIGISTFITRRVLAYSTTHAWNLAMTTWDDGMVIDVCLWV